MRVWLLLLSRFLIPLLSWHCITPPNICFDVLFGCDEIGVTVNFPELLLLMRSCSSLLLNSFWPRALFTDISGGQATAMCLCVRRRVLLPFLLSCTRDDRNATWLLDVELVFMEWVADPKFCASTKFFNDKLVVWYAKGNGFEIVFSC